MADSAGLDHRPAHACSIQSVLAQIPVAWSRLTEKLARRLSDPRAINPIWVFAGGLSVVVPVWLLFFNH
jgi:hypothetical protein